MTYKGPLEMLYRANECGTTAHEVATNIVEWHEASEDAFPVVRAAVQYGIDHGCRNGACEGFSVWAGPTHAAFRKRLRKWGLPSLGKLIRIGACITITRAVQSQLGAGGRIMDASREVGYPTSMAMTQFFRRHTGVVPSDLNGEDALDVAELVLEDA